jgi:sugar-specific transcriptional regulator TrmB
MRYLAKQLATLGLSALEASIYLDLLERDGATAGLLAKSTEIKRGTVYTVLDSLVDKGLISVTHIDAIKHYHAESMERIGEFLTKQKRDIEIKEERYKDLKDQLQTVVDKKLRAPKVSMYESKKGVEALLMRNLDDQPREILVFGEQMGARDQLEEFTNRRIKLKIPLRAFTPKGGFTWKAKKEEKSAYRKLYLLGEQYNFPASIQIYDHSVSIFSYTGKDPVGVHIENTDIADTCRMIFKLLESKSKAD